MAKIVYGKSQEAEYEYPFCKNTRLMIKTRCKGVSFKIKLPTRDQIKLANKQSNHTVYIGYNGTTAKNHLEIGLSYIEDKDKDQGYTWMWNYTGLNTEPGDNGRGTKYYAFGSEVLVQLYLDGTDMRLKLVLDNVQVWSSPRTHSWSEFTTSSGHLGTRIISSIEQSGWSSNIPHFQSKVDEVTISDIKIFLSDGWKSTKTTDVQWGYDDNRQGIEITLDEKYKDIPTSELGQYPIVTPGYGYVSNSFTCKYPL